MRQLKITKSITNRSTASIEKYLQDISKEPLISAEQEVELAQRIRAGDKIALEKLTKANLRFVVSVAKQYQGKGISLQDLINEGNLGLIKAASKFDETRGFKFISYAVWWIRQSILQAIAEQSRIIRLPLNQVSYINKVKQTKAELEQKLERPPTFKEIADELEMPEQKIKAAFQNSPKCLSTNAPVREDEDKEFIELLANDQTPVTDSKLIKESLNAEIQRSLSTLSEKEKEVINLYFGIGINHSLTFEEIAERFNLTRERARQIKEKAIRRLRNSSRSKMLRAYL
ncbi:MAG: RNA polymerase sigma factor RpoD/SigA [Bacteroidales bacterium]|nr:RNA polymerase sigma factor RpoD/SigA [Bacteroidales bacterium]